MKGLAINFQASGRAEVDLTRSAEALQANAQNMLVNLFTHSGTDFIYPQKGTTLLADGIQHLAVDLQSAQHICNFAALDTIFFARQTDFAVNAAQFALDVNLSSRVTTPGLMSFVVEFSFVNGAKTAQTITTK